MRRLAFRPSRVRTRLVAVMLVPLVGFAVAAGSTVRSTQHRAALAGEAQQTIRNYLLVDRLALRLRVERDLAVLLVRGRSAGADGLAVTALVGVDVDHSYQRARSGTEATLAALRGAHVAADTLRVVDVTRPPLSGWTGTADTLAGTYGVGMRRAEEAAGLGRADAQAAIARMGGGAALAALVTSAEYLDRYHLSAVSELAALTRLAVPIDGDTGGADRDTASTAEQQTIDELLSTVLPAEQQGTWAALRTTRAFTGFAKLHADLVDDRPAASPQPASAALARLLGMGLERSEALVRFTDQIGVELEAVTDRIEDKATTDADRLLAVVAALALATLALTGLVARSLTRPLHQVLDVASAVAGGNLGAMDLPTRGPREVTKLAEVVDVLGHNLAAIDAHARALAEGRLDDAALPVSLPGGIGSLLQLTMERLADETARLAHRARHDPLTGLLNRGAILDELAQATRAGRRTDGAVVAFVDLDGFKRVNDDHGHDLGDELLVAVAERLRIVPCPGTEIGRLGGDEFVAVCRYPSNSTELAGGLLSCFERPFALSIGPITLKASIGVAHCPTGSDPVEGLRRADQATYVAKRRGKAQLVMA